MAFSFWEDQTYLRGYDAVVIGGGIVGLSAACRLAELHPSWRVGVFEKSAFGDGGTTRNAGFACFGSPAELMEDRRALGDAAALELVRQRLDGLHTLRAWLGDAHIGFVPCGSHALYLPDGAGMTPVSSDVLRDLNAWAAPVTGVGTTFRRERVPAGRGLAEGLVADASPLEGAVDTGRLHRAMIEKARGHGIEVVRGVEVLQLNAGTPVELRVRRGREGERTVLTPKCLVATNAFARELLPEADAQPAANRVLVTAPGATPCAEGTYHLEAGYVYARHLPEGRLLIGGGRHWGLDEAGTEARLMEWLVRLWPGAAGVPVAYAWTGLLGVGAVRKPWLEAVGPGTVAAVRLGGMGVAIGAGLGRKAAELLAKSR